MGEKDGLSKIYIDLVAVNLSLKERIATFEKRLEIMTKRKQHLKVEACKYLNERNTLEKRVKGLREGLEYIKSVTIDSSVHWHINEFLNQDNKLKGGN